MTAPGINWYAVLHSANLWKREKVYLERANASFPGSRFFQRLEELQRRVRYVAEDDVFDFVGADHAVLRDARRRHVRRVEDLASVFPLGPWLLQHPEDACFPTALRAQFARGRPRGREFGVDVLAPGAALDR